jgi:CheY-like chemotaxis protein/anti-sigma regulatory factor (Ser/Thr protein kinase)
MTENSDKSLNLLYDLLKSEGYNTTVSHGDAAAFSLLIEKPDHYHVLILDYRHPNAENDELLNKIHATSYLKILPIIMVVSNTEHTTLTRAIHHGAHYCLSDDFSAEHALMVVQAAIKKNQSYRQYQSTSPTTSYPMMQYLVKGEFHIKTLPEAQDLARGLSTVCPNPNLAVVGISELLINAIEHGNLAITYAEKSQYKRDNSWESKIAERLKEPQHRNKIVSVIFERTETDFVIVITDQGSGFDAQKFINLSPERLLDTHGRGIVMAKNLVFKELAYSPKGNSVTCVIPRQTEPEFVASPKTRLA